MLRATKEPGVLTNMYLIFAFIHSFVQINIENLLCPRHSNKTDLVSSLKTLMTWLGIWTWGGQCYDGGTQGLWNPKGDTKLNLEVEVREDFLEEEVISELTPEE